MRPAMLPWLSLFICTPLGAQVQQGTWELAFDHTFDASSNGVWHGFHPPTSDNTGAKFNALHMALIPKDSGTNNLRGKVIVWDWEGYGLPGAQPLPTIDDVYRQRWSIVDPKNSAVVKNLLLVMPASVRGDPMCAGHAWTKKGNLFIAGGNNYTITVNPNGHQYTWLFEPDKGTYGTWTKKVDMTAKRWYPTVTMLADGRMMVSGGTDPLHVGKPEETYEVYDPSVGTGQFIENINLQRYPPLTNKQLFLGPGYTGGASGPNQPLTPNLASKFGVYPRIHLLPYGDPDISPASLGTVFMSAHGQKSARADLLQSPEVWFYPTGATSWHNSPFGHHRHDGSSILFPNLGYSLVLENTVFRLGGTIKVAGSTSVTNSVEYCAAGSNPTSWTNAPFLQVPRQFLNTVILPDGTILAIGGAKNWKDPDLGNDPDPAMNAELFVPGQQQWYPQPNMSSSRLYHSTAVLLPSGKVLTAGGEFGWLWIETTGGRSVDYQVFVPPYLAGGQDRPTILNPLPTPMTLGTASSTPIYKAYYSQLATDDYVVTRVVLMAPGSTTHHSDMHQRFVECVVLGIGQDAMGKYIQFYSPLGMGVNSMVGSHAPPGNYMLFILTNNTGTTWDGVPSEAKWVELK